MFTALPENPESLDMVMDRISNEFILRFDSEYGDFDLGTYTKVSTDFKIYDEGYRNPFGFLYNYKLQIDNDNFISKRRLLTKDIHFNVKNFGYCKSILQSPTFDVNLKTLIINGTTIVFSDETSFDDIVTSIENTNIENIFSYIDDGYLVIYSTKSSQTLVEYEALSLDGSSLSTLGLQNGIYKNSNPYFIINGLRYDVDDYEDGVNNYLKYFYVKRG